MAIEIVRVGDEGTVFAVTVLEDGAPVDLSSATVTEVRFCKPSGETSSLVATLTTDGSDGRMDAVSTTGFLDESGYWAMQGYVEMPTGKWHTGSQQFRVQDNFGS